MEDSSERYLDEAWAALDEGNLVRARSYARRVRQSAEYRAEVHHLLGVVAFEEGDDAQARELLEKAAQLEPENADIHYDLGRFFESIGDETRQRLAFLETLRLDAKYPIAAPISLTEDTLVEHAEELLSELPAELRDRLVNMPIIVEDRPSHDLVAEGFDPRALGLFEGPAWSDQGSTGPALTRVVLYRANIESVCRSSLEARHEVRVSLLHEIGHYFGLDEDGVARLGLA